MDLFLYKIADKKKLLLQGAEVDLTQSVELERYLEVLELMINKGAKSTLNDITPYEQLAILGVDKNNLKLLELLFSKKKIDSSFLDPEGKSLLMRAQELKLQKMAELLINNGALARSLKGE